jgi:hypothetical protein
MGTGGKFQRFFRGTGYWKTDTQREKINGGCEVDYFKDYSNDFKNELIYWRLIIEGKATLTELDTIYSLEDAMKLNTLLNLQNEIQNDILKDMKDEN